MSHVTSVVIQINDYAKEDSALLKLNNWLSENNHLGGEFEPLDNGKSAGTKCPEITLIWGGFNYLNIDEFIEFYNTLNLENSLLTIKYTDEGPYKVIESKEVL
jgi:hypothetical protein